ncbi:hypothetical protein [Gluconacetobacter takamatsuzukensis]|uniref:Uncharacterized protein n=1 Tax=Gluconacetobacter takamatsuzukensis TaxID=1286190 RepID=A0A7W4KBF4_9PROT|nr:hypothetical protein [Gluconacetobacter takamatsuzukensis]MBB2203862.1 hypothetical protein [Gluconacetobacter takamatsuzukensis]
MTHAAGIIGQILVHDWIGARQPACADNRQGLPLTQPPPRGRRAQQGWAGNRALSWPGYVASMRQMSAGLSRRVPFRRQR